MRTAISIFGRDRPGIIASLTHILSENNINIEDASMTILQEHFAMILVIDANKLGRDDVVNLVGDIDELSDLSISFSDEITETSIESSTESTQYIFQLMVADAPGIVAKVTKTLATFGANVVDCSTRKSNESDLFSMLLDVDVPLAREEEVVAALGELSQEFSGDVVFQRVDDVDL